MDEQRDRNTVPIRTARTLAAEAVAWLRRQPGVHYADVRFVEEHRERIRWRGGEGLEGLDRSESHGFGVRVLADGGWGFAATPHLDPARLLDAATRALGVARASAAASVRRVRWLEREGQRGQWEGPCKRDPFAVPLEEKLALLESATAALRVGEGPLRVGRAHLRFARRVQVLLSTERTDVIQCWTLAGAGLEAVAVGDDGEAQRRSYPTSLDGDLGQGGFERVEALRLTEEAPRIREEAIALLSAPLCPEGERTVILGTDQLALQIHESCGHPTELDRAMGTEISLAGGSFLQPSELSRLRYGSRHVTIVADATCPGGCGTFGWDDEGTPARRVPLVQEGLFVGYLSSRETAAAVGLEPSGAMRAESWSRLPLIRMVNVNLEPGRAGALEDLLADSEGALYIETNKSWSIDDLRLHFQFGCEAAWEVRGGRRATLYRNPVYSGVTPEFWERCDAVCGEEAWRLWGIGSCGKGEPMQLMAVGHGCAPARFRGVRVGHG